MTENAIENIKRYEAELDRLGNKLQCLQREEAKLKTQLELNQKQQEGIKAQVEEVFNAWRVLVNPK